MDFLSSFDSFHVLWNNTDKWQMITFIIVGCSLLHLIYKKAVHAGLCSLNILEKYRQIMNKREHDRENISKIDDIGKSLKISIEKINVMSQMIIDLSHQIQHNEDENIREHQELKEHQRKDQLTAAYDRLAQAYRYYKNRADDPSCQQFTGRKEWTCIEKTGFFMMLDNYHENGGDTYSHSVIEPYFQDWIIIDPENTHENDTYINR